MVESDDLTPSAEPATIKMKTEEEIRHRLGLLAAIERQLLRYPPAVLPGEVNVEPALHMIRYKVSMLRWVLGETANI